MNGSTEARNPDQISSGRAAAALAWRYLGSRRGLLVLSAIAVSAGLFLHWEWLAAAGVAPLLLALAPCAAMCALGLCMSKKQT